MRSHGVALVAAVAVAACFAVPARAQTAAPTEWLKTADPDTEVARRHFYAGTTFYNEARYEEAIAEFEAARVVKPLPAFDFNIGRCHDRLGQAELAIASYRRYLASDAPPADVAELTARIAVLETRVVKRAAAPKRPPPPQGPRNAAIVVGAVALVAAVLGTGLYASAFVDYQNQQNRCNERCSPGAIAAFRSDLAPRLDAGYVAWSVAGAAVIIDVILWVVDARRRSALPSNP